MESRGIVRSEALLQQHDVETSGPAKLQKRDDVMVDNVTIGHHEPDIDFVNWVHTEYGMTQDQIDEGRRNQLGQLVESEVYRPIPDDEKTDLLEKSGGRVLGTTWVDRIKPDGTAKS